MKLGAEDLMQIQVVNWLMQCTRVPHYHYANERKTSPQSGALLKRKGVKAGVLDLHLPRGNGKYKDLWIELKTPSGKISPAQHDFMNQRIEEGSCCHVARSFEEAVLMIKSFYGLG